MKEDDASEEVTEEMETFKNLVYSPSVEAPLYKEEAVLSAIHSVNVLAIAYWNPNDLFIFSTDVSNRLVCTNTDDKSIVCEVKVSAPCCALAVIQQGKYLLAGCMDGLLHVFAIKGSKYLVTSLEKIAQHKLHEKAILKMRSSDNLGYVLSTSYDNTVSLFSIAEVDGSVKEKARYYFKYCCDGIAFSEKHNAIILAERNQPFMTYIDISSQKKTEVSINHHEWDPHVSFCVTDLCWLHDEEYLLALTDKGNVVIYSYGNNSHISVIYAGSMLVDSYYNGIVAVDRDEKHVLTICPDNCIRVFSLYTGKEVAVLKGHTKTIRNMTCHRELSTTLFTCSFDHSIRVWKEVI